MQYTPRVTIAMPQIRLIMLTLHLEPSSNISNNHPAYVLNGPIVIVLVLIAVTLIITIGVLTIVLLLYIKKSKKSNK